MPKNDSSTRFSFLRCLLRRRDVDALREELNALDEYTLIGVRDLRALERRLGVVEQLVHRMLRVFSEIEKDAARSLLGSTPKNRNQQPAVDPRLEKIVRDHLWAQKGGDG